jgi:hypothetical protein
MLPHTDVWQVHHAGLLRFGPLIRRERRQRVNHNSAAHVQEVLLLSLLALLVTSSTCQSQQRRE